MQKFIVLKAPAAPFPAAHIDTDKILPARHMTTVSRKGLGRYLFEEARYGADGAERPEFVLNQPAWRDAGILIAYDNFGCGSSREHAPWALTDFGIRCLIAPSFGDIFRNNCRKNGLLTIVTSRAVCESLVAVAFDWPGEPFTVDLEAQRITLPSGETLTFDIDPREREVMLTGADDVTRSLKHEDAIAAFEARMG